MEHLIAADRPELVALAALASLAPSRMATAFNDPEHLFEHLTLEELGRLQGATTRLAALQAELGAALEVYREEARKLLEARQEGA